MPGVPGALALIAGMLNTYTLPYFPLFPFFVESNHDRN